MIQLYLEMDPRSLEVQGASRKKGHGPINWLKLLVFETLGIGKALG